MSQNALFTPGFERSAAGRRLLDARRQRLDADVARIQAIGKRVRMPGGTVLEPIYRSADDRYLFLPFVELPGLYVQRVTPLLVVVPAAYGATEPLRDAFVAADLRRKSGGGISRHLPNYSLSLLPGGADGSYRHQLARALGFPGTIPPLAYLCIHATQRGQGLWEYMKQLIHHLSNPVR